VTSQLPDRRPGGRAVVVYTALRLALFVAVVALGLAVGLRGIVLLLVAVIGSGVASWFLLAGPRARLGENVDRTLQRWRERGREEDDYVDALMAEQGVTRSDR
jgi:Protein of unknown function (DUF4229)